MCFIPFNEMAWDKETAANWKLKQFSVKALDIGT